MAWTVLGVWLVACSGAGSSNGLPPTGPGGDDGDSPVPDSPDDPPAPDDSPDDPPGGPDDPPDEPPPVEPLALAGHVRIATVGETVTIDGSKSAVPAGCSVSWTSSPETLSLAGGDTLTPRATPTRSGTYRLELSVSCPLGEAATDAMLVHALELPVASFPNQRFAYRVEGTAGDNTNTGPQGREFVFDPARYPDIDGTVREVWIDVAGRRSEMSEAGGGRFSLWVPGASAGEDRWFWAFVGENRFTRAPIASVRVELASADGFEVAIETPLAASFGGAAGEFWLLPNDPDDTATIVEVPGEGPTGAGGGRFVVEGDFREPRAYYAVAANGQHRSFPRMVTLPPAPKDPSRPDLGVAYQIYVKHFADSDGDGLGDLRGVIERLPYLADELGVDTLLLMPVFASPGRVGWGYAPSDLSKVHPDYGDNDDLRTLFVEAHARGLQVLVDVPMNHVHRSNPACERAIGDPTSPTSNWFYFFDDNQQWFGWDFRDDGALSHFFARRTSGDVAVNLDDLDARAEIIDRVAWLLDPNGDGDIADGADGFRLDYMKGPSRDFWRELARAAHAVNPDVALVGEAWAGPQEIGGFLREAGLNGAFDFPFQYAARGALEYGDAGRLYWHWQEARRHYANDGVPTPFVANHDVGRLVASIDGADRGRALAAASIVLTAPGNPLIFYGDELGMLAPKTAERDFDRRNGGAFPWTDDAAAPGQAAEPAGPALSKPPSLERQKFDANSIFAHYRALLSLRAAHRPLRDPSAHAWHYGELNDPGMYAVVRPSGGERVLVIVNLTSDFKEVRFSEFDRSTLLYRQGLGEGATLGPFGTHVYALP